MVKIGKIQELTELVTAKNTANAVGNKSVFVYATPFLVALMERTCIELLKEELEVGEVTVGTNITLDHLAPTPIGNTVTCKAKLIEQSRNKYIFKLQAFDKDKIIGEAIHTRFKVNLNTFLNNMKR